jgi:hypothetical protein
MAPTGSRGLRANACLRCGIDYVNIQFGGESTIPGDLGITGSIDRVTGEAWYLTFTRGKDKKVKRREMLDLVCKSEQ